MFKPEICIVVKLRAKFKSPDVTRFKDAVGEWSRELWYEIPEEEEKEMKAAENENENTTPPPSAKSEHKLVVLPVIHITETRTKWQRDTNYHTKVTFKMPPLMKQTGITDIDVADHLYIEAAYTMDEDKKHSESKKYSACTS